MQKIMSGGELWRALLPSALVLFAWSFTGFHWLYPLACAVLGTCVLAMIMLWPRFSLYGGVHLGLFAFAAWSSVSFFYLAAGMTVPLVAWCFIRGPTRPFILALIVALPIAALSGGTGSANGWQETLMSWFNLTFAQADLAVIGIRRTIHFTAYGLIALTLFRSAADLTDRRQLAVTALWVAGHAAFDELRQFMTPGRSGRLEDFLIDMIGAATFVSLYIWRQRKG
ncbi:MAG: VanZ family protein [Chthonomonas sp.]|nr:VanZ family protein [Chthonomonas sp.]